MKILLFGKTGLLGQALFPALKTQYHVIAPAHNECDITDSNSVKGVIEKEKPDMVINATGYTKVDDAEFHKEEAFKLNSEAVANLAKILTPKNIALVHFSTDYIFDGKKKEGYGESDSPSPLSVYGASKAAGERAILEAMKNYYLIRTAWVFGPGGKNFVDTIIDLAGKNPGRPLKMVHDQIGNPTYTLDLVQAVLGLLNGKSYGIYHLVNEGDCSWYEFTKEIFNIMGMPQEVIPIASKELSRPAPRPHYSILRNTKANKLRHWKEALKDYLKEKQFIL